MSGSSVTNSRDWLFFHQSNIIIAESKGLTLQDEMDFIVSELLRIIVLCNASKLQNIMCLISTSLVADTDIFSWSCFIDTQNEDYRILG